MSKTISKKINQLGDTYNIGTKLLSSPKPGARIVPTKTSRNDAKFGVRFDAGELVDGRWLNVNLQVNGEATETPLKEWYRRNGTHANLATGQFDTKAKDVEAETKRFLDDMLEKAKDSI